jgi:hypothetical protein
VRDTRVEKSAEISGDRRPYLGDDAVDLNTAAARYAALNVLLRVPKILDQSCALKTI